MRDLLSYAGQLNGWSETRRRSFAQPAQKSGVSSSPLKRSSTTAGVNVGTVGAKRKPAT